MSTLVDSYRFVVAGGGSITFPITGVAAGYLASRSPSFTLGTAPVENDVLVAFVMVNTNPTNSDTSGWTNAGGTSAKATPGDNSLCASLLYHRVTAGEAAALTVTWTLTNFLDTAAQGNIAVAVLRGVATTGELVGYGTASNANVVTPWVIADVTPTGDDCQIMAGVAGDGSETQTTPADYTFQASATVGGSCYLYSDDTLGSNGVATGTTNVTPSGSNEYVSIVACFTPA